MKSSQPHKSDDAPAGFLQALSHLEQATRGRAPKRVHDALVYLLQRTSASEAKTLDELAQRLTTGRSTRKAEAGRVDTGMTALDKLLGQLEAASGDVERFNKTVEALASANNAETIQRLAKEFAFAPKPKSKTAAIALLKSARNTRERAAMKAREAVNASPW